MGEYLIQIKANRVPIKLNGVQEYYNNGDWVKVGKLVAMALIDEGKAVIQNPKDLLDPKGVAVYAPEIELHELQLFWEFPTVGFNPTSQLAEPINIFLDRGYCFKDKSSPSVIRNPSRFANMVEVLHDFDVTLILRDFTKTVQSFGRELEVTRQAVSDLRIMSYQTCVVGIQNTKLGKAFYKAWQAENENGEYQALVRALFAVKPTVYYFTPDWGIA